MDPRLYMFFNDLVLRSEKYRDSEKVPTKVHTCHHDWLLEEEMCLHKQENAKTSLQIAKWFESLDLYRIE